MAEDGLYQKKLRDLQKYVPFLENTIRRLKTENGKPREAQISKLQSLLEILTDTKKKLKYDALRKCEEVILKLHDKVEKKPPVNDMHKHMCRSPPDTSTSLFTDSDDSKVSFSAARQKLNKASEFSTPASPSPPLVEQIRTKPVVIPTETINSRYFRSGSIETLKTDITITKPPWRSPVQNIPESSARLMSRPIINRPQPTMPIFTENPSPPGVVPQPVPPVWSNPEHLYQRRIDVIGGTVPSSRYNVWHKTEDRLKYSGANRELVNYADPFLDPKIQTKPQPVLSHIKTVPSAVIKVPEKTKEIDRNQPLPPQQQQRDPIRISFQTKPEVRNVTLNKPPLSESDLQDLLCPSSNESSGDSINDEMDLTKLEEIRAKISRELEEDKQPATVIKNKEKSPIKSPIPPKPKSPRVERVKEQDNIFGNLLSSLDEQLLAKKKKPEKKDGVPTPSPSSVKKEEAKKVEKQKPEHKDPTKVMKPEKAKLPNKDCSSNKNKMDSDLNEKESQKEEKIKIKLELKKPIKDETKSELKPKIPFKLKDFILNENKSKDSSSKSKDKPKHVKKPENIKLKDKIKNENIKTEPKPAKDEQKEDLNKEKRQEKIKSKDVDYRIPKIITDLCEKTQSTTDDESKESCRLSDKYPHKRKSIDTPKPAEVENEDDKPTKAKTTEVHPLKLTDPRLRKNFGIIRSPDTDEDERKRPEPPVVSVPNPYDVAAAAAASARFQFQNDGRPGGFVPQKIPIITENVGRTMFDARGNMYVDDSQMRPPHPTMMASGNRCNMFPENQPRFPGDQRFFQPTNEGFMNRPNLFSPPQEAFPDPQQAQMVNNRNIFGNEQPPRCKTPLLVGRQFQNERPPSNESFQSSSSGNQPYNTMDQFPEQNNRIIEPPRHQMHPTPMHAMPSPMHQPGNYPRNLEYWSSRHSFTDENSPQTNFQNFPQPPQQRFQQQNNNPQNFGNQPIINPQTQPNFQNPAINPAQNQPNFQNPPAKSQTEPQFESFQTYDLSQMNPIDFYDENNKDNTTSVPDRQYPGDTSRGRPFRGRGGTRGGGNRGFNNRHGSESSSRWYNQQTTREDSRRFEHSKDESRRFESDERRFEPQEESSSSRRFEHTKDDSRRPNNNRSKSESRDPRRHPPRDEDHRRYRDEKDDYSRRSSRDDPRRYRDRDDRFPSSRSEDRRKYPPKDEDYRRSYRDARSTERNIKTEQKEDNTKSKEDHFSPLDSLYHTTAGPPGGAGAKGYGFQKFKIPKIKKDAGDERKEDDKNEVMNVEPEIEEVEMEVDEDSIVERDDKKRDEDKRDVKKDNNESTDFNQAERELFEDLLKKTMQSNDPSGFIELLQRVGCFNEAKTKRIARIIESDSESDDESQPAEVKEKVEADSTEHPKSEEKLVMPDPKTPEKTATTTTSELSDTTTHDELVVESVGERIKSRRRIISNCKPDSVVDSSSIELTPPKKDVKVKAKRGPKKKKRSPLEMLHDDIREMFISEGVLNANGQRMCRMMKEHQDNVLNSSHSDIESLDKGSQSPDEPKPVRRRRPRKPKAAKSDQPAEPTRVYPKRTRTTPRVVLEKTDMSKYLQDQDESELSEEEQQEKSKSRKKRTVATSEPVLPVETTNKRERACRKKSPIRDRSESEKEEYEEEEEFKESDTEKKTKKVSPMVPLKKKGKKRTSWSLGYIKKKPVKTKPAKRASTPTPSVTDTETTGRSTPNDLDSVKSRESSDEDENSLLKIDSVADVDYYLDNRNKYDCKLCDYKGKMIVNHYRTKHVEAENMISRLNPTQAENAKEESIVYNFEEVEPMDEMFKSKKKKHSFVCRFCSYNVKQEFVPMFYDHLCGHTGEYRYKCVLCQFHAAGRKTLSVHYHTAHPTTSISIIPEREAPPNYRIIFGWLCGACNFTQLLRSNLEKHIKVTHPDQTNLEIYKISMSSKRVNLEKSRDEDDMDDEEEQDESETVRNESIETTDSKEENKAAEEVPRKIDPPAPPKEPDLTVFMVTEDAAARDKLIEDERIKKMEEVISNITPRRSTLQFVDKLKTKLDSVQFDEQLHQEFDIEEDSDDYKYFDDLPDELPEELPLDKITPNTEVPDDLEMPVLEPQITVPPPVEAQPQIPPPPEPSSTVDDDDDKWLEITNTCSLAAADTNSTDSDSLDEPPDDINLDLSSPLDSKDNDILNSTIQRLTENLQNPKLPLVDEDDQKKVINVGSIEVRVFKKQYDYLCLLEGCQFRTEYKIGFTKHCSEQHKMLMVACNICDETKPLFTMMSLFVHLFDKHKENAKAVVETIKEEPILDVGSPESSTTPGKIRIRRISGDTLSSFSPVVEQPEEKRDNGFLQILDVRSLTEEEFQLATPEVTTKDAEPSTSNTIKFVKPNEETSSDLTREITNVIDMDRINKCIRNIIPTLKPIAESTQSAIPASSSTEKVPEKILNESSTIKFTLPSSLEEPCKKTPEIMSRMLEPISIVNLYKCPFALCAYTTDRKYQFTKHIDTHIIPKDAKLCVYCPVVLKHHTELTNHIYKQHGHCYYQCAYCFYRAFVPSYVKIHQTLEHKEKSLTVLVLEQTVNIAAKQPQLDDLLPRKDSVLMITCRQGLCRRKFLLIEEFDSHIVQFHPEQYICTVCEVFQEFYSPRILFEHFQSHGIGMYQCRFCLYGTNKPEPMLEHYSKEHQAQSPIAIVRQYIKTKKLYPSDKERVDDLDEINLEHLTSSVMPTLDFNKAQSSTSASKKCIDLIDLSTDLEVKQQQNDEPLVTIKPRTAESLNQLESAVDPLIINVETLSDDEPLPHVDKSDTTKSKENLTGLDLYKCGQTGCEEQFDTGKELKSHLFRCDFLDELNKQYTCYHCAKKFKLIGSLIDHLEFHGVSRFTCAVCYEKAPLSKYMVAHMKAKHKINSIKLIPLDPVKRNMAVDQFTAMDGRSVPKQVLLPVTPVKKPEPDVMLNSYGPEDIDKLPRQPVYVDFIKCKLCTYSTKVRTNIQRHLQQHIEEKTVPESAPVNPVPCLEKNEKMFDKMTNLAASSFQGRMGGKSGEKDKTGKEDEDPVPGFIPVNKRFVCGAEGCNYLTHGDVMFRNHFTTLHGDEVSYKCPHCKLQLHVDTEGITIENILFHLKMHDLHLYKCSHCTFYHYQKHKIEKHLTDKHPDRTPYINIIRELDSSANVDDRVAAGILVRLPEDKQWKCGFCEFRCVTRAEIQNHAARIHSIKSQFKCGECNYRCSAKNNYNNHFKTKHPNQQVSIIAVYQKIPDTARPAADAAPEPEVFDTTPLWSRDKPRIRHIRGILLDESRQTKKVRNDKDDVSRNLFATAAGGEKKSPKKSESARKSSVVVVETKTQQEDGGDGSNMKTIFEDCLRKEEAKMAKQNTPDKFDENNLGQPIGSFYLCPVCGSYKHKNTKIFVLHLYMEMNYYRYLCNICNSKYIDMNQAKIHWTKKHPMLTKGHISSLPTSPKIEAWATNCLKHQHQIMVQNESTSSANPSLPFARYSLSEIDVPQSCLNEINTTLSSTKPVLQYPPAKSPLKTLTTSTTTIIKPENLNNSTETVNSPTEDTVFEFNGPPEDPTETPKVVTKSELSQAGEKSFDLDMSEGALVIDEDFIPEAPLITEDTPIIFENTPLLESLTTGEKSPLHWDSTALIINAAPKEIESQNAPRSDNPDQLSIVAKTAECETSPRKSPVIAAEKSPTPCDIIQKINEEILENANCPIFQSPGAKSPINTAQTYINTTPISIVSTPSSTSTFVVSQSPISETLTTNSQGSIKSELGSSDTNLDLADPEEPEPDSIESSTLNKTQDSSDYEQIINPEKPKPIPTKRKYIRVKSTMFARKRQSRKTAQNSDDSSNQGDTIKPVLRTRACSSRISAKLNMKRIIEELEDKVEDKPRIRSSPKKKKLADSSSSSLASSCKSPPPESDTKEDSKTANHDWHDLEPNSAEVNCDYCNYIAKNTLALKKHRKRHFQRNQFSCKNCKNFHCISRKGMNTHYAYKHPDAEVEFDELPHSESPVFRNLKRKRKLDESVEDTTSPPAEQIDDKIEEEPPAKKKKLVKKEKKFDATGDIVYYICYRCPRRDKSLNVIREHFISTHGNAAQTFKYKKATMDSERKNIIYNCIYCTWCGPPDGLKQHHMDKHNDKQWALDKGETYKCIHCDLTFGKVLQFRKHSQANHFDDDMAYQTLLGGEIIETVEFMEEPIIKCEPTEIKCEYCDFICAELTELRTHHSTTHADLEFRHDPLKDYKCPQCNHTSNSYPAMRDHIRLHTKPYKCHYCSLTGSYPNILKTHHVKEHRNLAFKFDTLEGAMKELLESQLKILFLTPNGTYETKPPGYNYKRPTTDSPGDSTTPKILALDTSQIKTEKTTSSTEVVVKRNIAKKSTAKPPKRVYVAKKSTTPQKRLKRELIGYSYYGTEPCDVSQFKNVTTEINIMGQSRPITVDRFSLIVNLCPKVLLEDCAKTTL